MLNNNTKILIFFYLSFFWSYSRVRKRCLSDKNQSHIIYLRLVRSHSSVHPRSYTRKCKNCTIFPHALALGVWRYHVWLCASQNLTPGEWIWIQSRGTRNGSFNAVSPVSPCRSSMQTHSWVPFRVLPRARVCACVCARACQPEAYQNDMHKHTSWEDHAATWH